MISIIAPTIEECNDFAHKYFFDNYNNIKDFITFHTEKIIPNHNDTIFVILKNADDSWLEYFTQHMNNRITLVRDY